MFNRRKLDRERLEIYLVHLLLAYQHWIFRSGLVILVLGVAVTMVHPPAGFSFLLAAFYLLLLSSSYRVVLYTARIGAWIGMLGRNND
jgi:hypothetical protein